MGDSIGNEDVASLHGALHGVPQGPGERHGGLEPDIGPKQIGCADEGNVRLAERPTVRNKAW